MFFNTTDFRADAATRARIEDFGDARVPLLACTELAIFKAFRHRTRDWADLEEMRAADSLDVERVLLGADDERIERLRSP